MTDPLIDRDDLAALMDEVTEQIALGNPFVTYADAAISYLRDRLTPEALRTPEHFLPTNLNTMAGAYLHRRIFGEDK